MNVIEASDISKQFKRRGKKFYALRNVSLSVRSGEIFGLLGPNGAGKTTLLNIFIDLLLPDSGEAKLLGRKPGAVLQDVNFVSGDARFHWALTVRNILEFYGRVYALPEAKRKRRAEQLIKFFGLQSVSNSKYGWLSTGERMRVSLAKAMLNRPKILFLDEPTLGLDPDIAIRVRDEIRRVNRRFGTTILLTSHYMHEVEQLCGRIAFIHHGSVLDIGPVSEVKKKRLATYDVIITVDKVRDAQKLRAAGFRIRGNVLSKRMRSGERVNKALRALKRMHVINVETKWPTLEDYFVRMAKRGDANEME